MDRAAGEPVERAPEEAPASLAYQLRRIPGCKTGWIGPDGRRFAFFSVPMPPSTNHLWVNLKQGGRARAAGYAKWLVEAGWAINIERPCNFAGPVRIELKFERTNRAADLDNRIKPMLDLLQKMRVIENDTQVIDLRARWWLCQGCRVKVEDANLKAREHASEAARRAIDVADPDDDPSAFLDG